MRLQRFAPFCLATAVAIALGCSGEPTSQQATTGKPAADVDGPNDAAPDDEADAPIGFESVAYEELASALGEHQGKVVVLDLWATW